MPIKGMFNQKPKKKNEIDWEKQILRINSLEVQMKSLLEFEKQIRTSMYKNSSSEKKEQRREKTQVEDFQARNRENSQKFEEINKRLAELGQRVDQLENDGEEIEPYYAKNTFPREAENKRDERLSHFIEQLILEKYSIHFQREKQMVEKIQALESQISNLKHSVEQSTIEDHRQTPTEEFLALEHTSKDRDEKEDFYTGIEMRVQLLEQNVLLVNEVQVGLLKRIEKLIEKMEQMDEAESSMEKEEPILKTLYVDKLYLDKYEQNNNFAQLGIKNLSGALNIGATYGKEAIPKNITEQVKEDMAKMKEMKEEIKNNQPNTDEPDDTQQNELSSEVATNPSEENFPYTDIVIEDDDNPLGGDSFNDNK